MTATVIRDSLPGVSASKMARFEEARNLAKVRISQGLRLGPHSRADTKDRVACKNLLPQASAMWVYVDPLVHPRDDAPTVPAFRCADCWWAGTEADIERAR